MDDPRAPRLSMIRALAMHALVACAGGLSLLGASPGAAQDCFDPAAELDPNRFVADLFRFEDERVTHPFALYLEPCDGALFVVTVPEGERLVRVNESWRANDIIAARWVEGAGSDTIEVVANFSTGIGPEGARSFPARFVLTRSESGVFVSAYHETAIIPWAVLAEAEFTSHTETLPLDLLKPWLIYAQDEDEELQSITIHLGGNSVTNPGLSAIAVSLPRRAAAGQVEMLAEFSGLADDSVSAMRLFAIANRVDGGWRLEQVWRQFRCARGADPSSWTADLCP